MEKSSCRGGKEVWKLQPKRARYEEVLDAVDGDGGLRPGDAVKVLSVVEHHHPRVADAQHRPNEHVPKARRLVACEEDEYQAGAREHDTQYGEEEAHPEMRRENERKER